MRRATCVGFWLAGVLAVAAACHSSATVGSPDASSDASRVDAHTDVAIGEVDASEAGVTYYSALTFLPNWSAFDLTSLNANAVAYCGGTFDGTYIYLAQDNAPDSSLIARYNTTLMDASLSAFTTASSWTLFDTTQIALASYGFAGAAFDGTHVYFVPRAVGAMSTGNVAQYDTNSQFESTASWSTYDISNGVHAGYQGAVYDRERYVYFVPFYNSDTAAYSGLFVRYDTTASFTAAGSYANFDATSVAVGALGFNGGVFDGRYVYAAPSQNGVVTRYDTEQPFTVSGAWLTFDVETMIGLQAGRFAGAAFDGRYVYFVPSMNSIIVRYDTTVDFASAPSWDTFDANAVNVAATGFGYSVFDGRYMYFLPFGTGTASESELLRYDTHGSFSNTLSWSSFDTATVQTPAKAFCGGMFDGEYVYLIPNGTVGGGPANGLVVRFDAKYPPSMPSEYSGSFF
jgi:hypothetical protein